MANPHDESSEDRSGVSLSPRLIAGIILGAALTLLIVQNTRSTTVKWLIFETEQPLWVVLLVTAAAALVIAELVGSARRRSKRRAGR